MPPVGDQSRQQIENLQQQMQQLQVALFELEMFRLSALSVLTFFDLPLQLRYHVVATGLQAKETELRQKNAQISRLTTKLRTAQVYLPHRYR